MRRYLHRPRDELISFILALTLAVVLTRPYSAAAAEESRQLQLEVYINDAPARLIGSFVQLPDQRIAARRAELAEVGLRVPGSGSGDELVVIDDLSDIAYRYDEPTQKIFFKLGDERRIAQTYDLRGSSDAIVPARADYGSVLNYALFAASTTSSNSSVVTFSGANASLDGRLFSPYGTLSQSAKVP